VPTRNERKSAGIAKRLVKALADIEEYDGDPLNVFDDAKVTATQYKAEVGKLVEHLEKYYSQAEENQA
jgi:hypothetical protein